MILTRSPYYKIVPWRRPSDNEIVDSYKLELFIWTGDKVTDKPLFSTYDITKENIQNAEDDDKIDIARLIEDYIENTVIDVSTTGIQSGNCTVWVSHQVQYSVGANITQELQETDFATKGYGYGFEGENYESTMVLLTDSIELDAHNESMVFVPINRELTTNDLTIISYPDQNINITLSPSFPVTTLSDDIVSTVSIDCADAGADKYIEVSHLDEMVTIYLRSEFKHTPYEVQFINRYGASQTLTFFKERKDSIEVEGSEFESSFGQPINGTPQFKKYNVNGMSSFTLETGYIEEGSNNLVKQLVLSENVWLNGLPVTCKTSNVEYMNRVNDRVVNYTMQFTYAFNEINTI